MREAKPIRRESRCPAADFRHRLRVGIAVAALIMLLSWM